MFDQLAVDMQPMLDRHPGPGNFWATCASQFDHVEGSAGAVDGAFVHERIDAIPISYGLSPAGLEEPDSLEAAE